MLTRSEAGRQSHDSGRACARSSLILGHAARIPAVSALVLRYQGQSQQRKTPDVTATNLDNLDSYSVQFVIVNGKAWNRDWFEHGDVMVEGGIIELVLGPEMMAWDTTAVPPDPRHLVL